jgi:hypothetical protein
MEYEVDKKGHNLVEQVPLVEIVPSVKYYMLGEHNMFYPAEFHPEVNWDSVVELSKYIYRIKSPAKAPVKEPLKQIDLW